MNSIGLAAAIIVALVASVGGFITARSGGRASPYDALATRVTTLEKQRGEDMVLISSQQTEIAGLQRRVAGMIEDRDSLVTYVVIVRNWVAGGSKPPAPTIPRHLADVLPEWQMDDSHEAALITEAKE